MRENNINYIKTKKMKERTIQTTKKLKTKKKEKKTKNLFLRRKI